MKLSGLSFFENTRKETFKLNLVLALVLVLKSKALLYKKGWRPKFNNTLVQLHAKPTQTHVPNKNGTFAPTISIFVVPLIKNYSDSNYLF